MNDLDKINVATLNNVINKTHAIIVLTSSWRMFGLRKVNEALKAKGFLSEIRFATTKEDKPRGVQIKEFINKHNINRYVVIDDEDYDIKSYIPNNKIIKLSYKKGLQDFNVKNIIKKLNNKKECD